MSAKQPTETKPRVLIMGQTPPPWHGQAVATQQIFDHAWPGFEVLRIRMEFSSEMEEVGRFQFQKIIHMLDLFRSVRKATRNRKDGILLYPPASPNWVPILRDLVLLPLIRNRFGTVVYLYHAGGIGEWCARSRLRLWIARIAYGKADLSLEVAKENPAPHEILEARRWAWTPYGVEVPPLAAKIEPHTGPTVVLYVGSLQEGKGVLEVLKAASMLKKRGKEREFHFRIVGRWFSKAFEAEATRMVSELELENMVEFPGQLTGNEKWRAYADSHVFFFPTHYASEAFPLVLIEALGCGLPVVTTRWRGIPDLLDGCSAARLCEVRSPGEYVDALLDLRKQAGDGEDFSKEARSFYEERYLPENFLEQIQSLLHATALGAEDRQTPVDSEQPGRRVMVPILLPRDPGKDGGFSGRVSPSQDDIPVAPTVIDLRYRSDDDSAAPHARGALGESALPARSASSDHRPSTLRPSVSSPISISIYLADQNPGHDRSFGISRMSQVVISALRRTGEVEMRTVVSKTSQQPPPNTGGVRQLPWGTRGKTVRLLTDHLHPLFRNSDKEPDLYYFPKGYLPLTHWLCNPSVVTIHDTIIQHYADFYPKWRKGREYSYWSMLLRHTLRHADRILTVSESSKQQIESFMARHRQPAKEITVTYEPCQYESIPQPEENGKGNNFIHLASREPHKRSAHLIRWWHEAENEGRRMPTLHLVGTVPNEVEPLLSRSRSMVRRPFLDDAMLQEAYLCARALILPSEIEGFGLPALEAYYLGTPVCYVKGTSVEEILSPATSKGGFTLDDPASLFAAMDEVVAMGPEEIRECGLKLRETYASEKVAERMLAVFREVKIQGSVGVPPASP